MLCAHALPRRQRARLAVGRVAQHQLRRAAVQGEPPVLARDRHLPCRERCSGGRRSCPGGAAALRLLFAVEGVDTSECSRIEPAARLASRGKLSCASPPATKPALGWPACKAREGAGARRGPLAARHVAHPLPRATRAQSRAHGVFYGWHQAGLAAIDRRGHQRLGRAAHGAVAPPAARCQVSASCSAGWARLLGLLGVREREIAGPSLAGRTTRAEGHPCRRSASVTTSDDMRRRDTARCGDAAWRHRVYWLAARSAPAGRRACATRWARRRRRRLAASRAIRPARSARLVARRGPPAMRRMVNTLAARLA